MDLFNRVVIILLILAAMIAIPLILIFPEQAESVLRYTADVIQANLVWLNSLSPTAYMGVRVLLIAAGGVVFVIGLLFLILEVIRIRRKTVRLKDGSGELAMDGVTGHLVYHIDMLAGVLRVKPQVVSKGKSVQVSLQVETAPDVSVPDKAAEIKEMARQIVEEQLGLQLKGDVRVIVKPVPYPRQPSSRRRRRSRKPPAPPSEPQGEETAPTGSEEGVDEVKRAGQATDVALDEGFAPPMEVSEPATEGGESQIIEAKGPAEGPSL